MADSAALRSRRSRAHAAGDCSLCRHPRAPVLTLASATRGAPADPRERLESLAGRLEAAHEADPANALLARELRATLTALVAGDDDSGFDVG
jgi:hypothetical protein